MVRSAIDRRTRAPFALVLTLFSVPVLSAWTDEALRLHEVDARDVARVAETASEGGRGGTAMALRAAVHGLVAGSKPTPLQIGQASRLADRAVTSMPDAPYGYAARCEIAMRLDDATMVAPCAAELARIAPGHPDTEKARAWLAARRRNPRFMTFGWVVVALLALVAGVHAIASLATRRRLAAAALAVLACISASTPAHASAVPDGDSNAIVIDDANPEASVPPEGFASAHVLTFGYYLMDMSARAERAFDEGRHAQALRYYRALSLAVPDRALSFARMCRSHLALGDVASAREACRTAVEKTGATADDFERLAGVLLSGTGALAAGTAGELDALIAHLRARESSGVLAARVECGLGVRLGDARRLATCVPVLERSAPDDPRTISFAWALASALGDHASARRLVARAKAAHLDADAVARMEASTNAATSLVARATRAWPIPFGIALLGLSLFVVAVSRRREDEHAPS